MIVTPARIQSLQQAAVAGAAAPGRDWTRSFTPTGPPPRRRSRTVPARWPSPRIDAHHVGEVLLALRVAGGDPLDRVGQQGAVKGRSWPGVDPVDGPLRRGGVGILHDLGQRAAVVPDDAPVPGLGQGARAVSTVTAFPAAATLTDQRGQRLRAQRRHVRVG